MPEKSVAIMVTIVPVIPVAVAVPAVIVLDSASLSVPVTVKELSTLISRADPSSPPVRHAGPIAVMPFPVVSGGIPIAIQPNEIGTGGYRPDANYPGWRR